MEERAISARVRGRVQGVGFRISVIGVARTLGVDGWVRNAADGSVEVFAQGPPDLVAQFLAYLRRGPRGASVDGVDAVESSPNPALRGFDLRF